ncbi:hypothetical protein ATANTOWER_030053 [Ataeniobius toweri]|uniref:Uncharacterized protein n=1 Tax=Ataeniobius toweri TaxID=208326 RepID=A0ABU7B1C9_9TELE|nr:hypothetical protein [Ataeniobius toweri]
MHFFPERVSSFCRFELNAKTASAGCMYASRMMGYSHSGGSEEKATVIHKLQFPILHGGSDLCSPKKAQKWPVYMSSSPPCLCSQRGRFFRATHSTHRWNGATSPTTRTSCKHANQP